MLPVHRDELTPDYTGLLLHTPDRAILDLLDLGGAFATSYQTGYFWTSGTAHWDYGVLETQPLKSKVGTMVPLRE